MKIAITSGKGGVGKTFVAACLARVLSGSQPVRYIDCDVEAPNAQLFLRPEIMYSQPQTLSCITGMDPDKCTHCGRCAKVCYFNALIVGKKNAMAFPELCRWCGACQAVCPADALTISQRTIGTVFRAESGNIDLHWAALQAGAGGMTVRLIRHIQQPSQDDTLTILDSPPGTSCAVVQTIRGADRVVLVADPTRFGQHDLKLSVHLCRSMDIEPVVLINRAGIGDLEQLRQWCRTAHLDILAEIPDDRRIAEGYSQGLLPVEYLDDLNGLFLQIAQKLSVSEGRQKPIPFTAPDESLFLNTPPLPENPPPMPPSFQKPREIVVISGKGGTGKTSLAACFAQLARGVIADCDVDAADLHLLIQPTVLSAQPFTGGRIMSIDPARCTACGQCVTICQWNAITAQNNIVSIAADRCEGCGACLHVCPADAVLIRPTNDGLSYWSSTRLGGMSHATLEPGKENSGKLVTLVRSVAAWHADSANVAILDGSPGTGCPVIASISGAKAAVIVTEPTVSGLHDLKRILEVTRHFKITAGIIINKNDLNPHICGEIRRYAAEQKTVLLGELPYNNAFIQAQQNGQTLLEYQPDSLLANTVRSVWKQIQTITNETGKSNESRSTQK
jgi:MinD superfamily P-loop ATPase